MVACLPASQPPACCLLACLLPAMPACLPPCLLACLLACMPTSLHAWLRACLHATKLAGLFQSNALNNSLVLLQGLIPLFSLQIPLIRSLGIEQYGKTCQQHAPDLLLASCMSHIHYLLPRYANKTPSGQVRCHELVLASGTCCGLQHR